MKKMIVLSLTASLLLLALTTAQTLSLHVDDGGVLTREHDVISGVAFDVVTLIDTGGHDIAAVEWVQSALSVIIPGVFKLSSVDASCDISLDVKPEGEYQFGLCGSACFPAATDLELARVTYADFTNVMRQDVVLTIRGFQPGDSSPSSFDGSPGFVDCSDALVAATMQGGDAWITGAGVEVPSGALVLNPTPPLVIGTQANSFARIKGVYR